MDNVIFYGLVGALLLWYFFMMTFRTGDFINLMKSHEEQRVARRKQNARLASSGAKIAGVIAKLFMR